MGYTLSFIADTKCTAGDVGGLLHHDARAVDQVNGCEVQHSNKDIDPARTPLNTTVVADGKGGWVDCTDVNQITDALAARLAHVKKPLRKDAVVLRPFVLQLDPEWYKEHTDTGERVDAEQHMMDWAADTFGAENLLYVAVHEDEGSRHLHVGFCPVTADGRLAQKDWFPSPADLRKKHDEFREHMTAAGYDIMKERKKPGKHAKRMSVEEYKDFAQLQDERRDVEQQREQLDADKTQLHADRLNARAEAQRIRQQAQNAGAVYVENAKATAEAAENDATEYRARRRSEADEEAEEIRRQAEVDAQAIRDAAKVDAEREAQEIRAAAQRDAEAKQKAWEEKRDQMKAEFKQQLETQLQEKREEYNTLQNAHRAAQEAAQRDLRAWDAQEAREGLNALLAASGAAVKYVATMTASKLREVDDALRASPAMQRLMRMNAQTDARNAAHGPTTVEGPTM